MRRKTGPRRLAIAALTTMATMVAFLALPPRAQACSCMAIDDVGAAVDNAPAAVVGTFVERRSTGFGQLGQEAIYTFEVEAWIKGDLGPVIEVVSATDSAACGLGFLAEGDRVGLLLYLQGDELRSDLCSQIDPDALLAAAPEVQTPAPHPPTPAPVPPKTDTTTPPLTVEDLDPGVSAQTTARIALAVLGAAAVGAGVLQTVKRRRAPR